MNMRNNLMKIVSLLIVFSVVFGLCSCKLMHKPTGNAGETTNRSVTLPSSSKATAEKTDYQVTAIAPESKEDIIKYFNDSLEYFYQNDFEFTRKKSSKLKSYSGGSLVNVEGATQSYVSMLRSACSDMMGVGSLSAAYYIGDDISSAFEINPVESQYLKKCTAVAEKSNVKIAFEYKQFIGEDVSGVTKLTGDYVDSGGFSRRISGYGASASSPKAVISGIKLTALIDYATNNFISLRIEFSTAFSAESISFDYVSGGPVSGSTKTVISYGNFTEK